MFGWKLIRTSEYEDLQDLVGSQADAICRLHEELNESERRRASEGRRLQGLFDNIVRQRDHYADQLDAVQRELGAERWRDVGSEDVFEKWAAQSRDMTSIEETG